jgi:hypothetical protein
VTTEVFGMSFRQRYADLVRRHLGREPKRSDGVSEAALVKCERRLAVRLPAAVREYYLMAGRLEQLNRAHNFLYTPDELRIEDEHLWFMEENQAVVHWGLPLKRLTEDDPMVYQRANVENARWYSQRMRFSTFLIRVYDWQAGFADAPR